MVSRAMINNWPIVAPSLPARPGPGETIVMRPDATNADAANIIPVTGAAQFSFGSRAVHYSQHPIPKGSIIELMVPLWTFSLSGNVTEILLPEAYDFAAALEYPFFPGRTAIPTDTRTQARTADGQAVYSYVPGAGPFFKLYIKVPVTIPAQTPYGIWLVHECVAGRTGAVTNKQICRAQSPSNYINRWEGTFATATQGAGYIGSNGVMTVTSVNALSPTQTGLNANMIVGAIRLPMPSSHPSVLINGNSIEAGNQEGYGASITALGAPQDFGDSSGDRYGNRGWAMRHLWKRGIACCQMSKGSDKDSYRLLAGNYAARNAWQAALGVTHMQDMNPHNEITAGITPATSYQNNVNYELDAPIYTSGNNLYICTQAGLSAAAGTGPAGTGADILDGAARFTYIGPYDPADASESRNFGGWVGGRRKRLRLDQAAMPGVRILGATQPPDSSCQQTASAYNYDSGTGLLTLTVPSVAGFIVGSTARVQGLTPSALNLTLSPVIAIDTDLKTVTLQAATGLAAPTGTATLNSEWVNVAGQVPNTGFAATNSLRSYINRFLRAQPNPVLPYEAIVDIGKFTESGAPTTIGAETGAWRPLSNGGVPVGGAPTYDNTHPTSWMYEEMATLAAGDGTVAEALAA